MSINLVTEILATHADQLNRGEEPHTDALLAAFPEERKQLAALLNVATRLKRAFPPVPAPPAFRSRLRDELTMAARQRTTVRSGFKSLENREGVPSAAQAILIERRGDAAWGWVIGAAALGSAAGLIAIALRARHAHRTPSQPAAQESAN